MRAAEQKTLEVNSRFEQLRSQLQRETDETRQRLNKAADERARREKADFIASLLPVLDNLQRATEAAEPGSSPEVIAKGIRQTAASFEKALAAAGVEPINAVGEHFDPNGPMQWKPWSVDGGRGNVIAQHARYRMGERLCGPRVVKLERPAGIGKKSM